MSSFVNANNEIGWKQGEHFGQHADVDHGLASLSLREIAELMRGNTASREMQPYLDELPFIPVVANRKTAAN